MKAAAENDIKGAYPRTLNRQIHGLRGFSALAVFVFHIYGMATLYGFWPSALDAASPIFQAGRHGVEIFFAISGYLITASLIRHGDARAFLIDRAIRIYPVFLTIHLIVFALGPFIHYKWMAGIGPFDWTVAFVSNALFLPGIFDLPLAQLNAATLSYEAAFYLFSAGIFIMSRRLGRRAAIIALVLLLPPIFFVFQKMVFFPVGAAVYFIVSGRKTTLPAVFRALSVPALLLCLGILTVAEETHRFYLVYPAALPAFVFFWSVVDGHCLLSAFLRTRPLQYLGTVSYSFYLWAPAVTYPLKILVVRLFGISDSVGLFVFFGISGLFLSLAVADLSYRLLEDRAGKLLHRRLAMWRQSGALQAAE